MPLVFSHLAKIDEQLARWVASQGCPKCGGPLHRGDYQRKPRGGLVAAAGEAFRQRYSLCCGQVGCRKRALPPSVRFLGRKVYLESVILIASVHVQLAGAFAQAHRALAVPVRTLKRWSHWWHNDFAQSREWQAMRAQFAPPAPAETELPHSLLQRLASSIAGTPEATEPAVLSLAALLCVTTFSTSLRDDSTRLKSKRKLVIVNVLPMVDRDLLRLGHDHDRP